MNRAVGYRTSIVAQMIVDGEIKGKGLLAAVRDIPYRKFLDEMRKRGIVVDESWLPYPLPPARQQDYAPSLVADL